MLIFDHPTKDNFHAFSMEMFYMYCTVHVCLAECNTPALAIGGMAGLHSSKLACGKNSFSVPVFAVWKPIARLILVMINYQDQRVLFLHICSYRPCISSPDHAAGLLTSHINMHLKTSTDPYPPFVVTIMYHGNGSIGVCLCSKVEARWNTWIRVQKHLNTAHTK